MASKHAQAKYLISTGIFDSVSSFAEFEQRLSGLNKTNTKAQGDAFEVFVEAYLATQPMLQCKEIWLVGDIPSEVRLALNLPNDSKGIDGVYKSVQDSYIPYQVKFRTNRPHLGFNEVAPFLGITEKANDRILITNCDAIAVDVRNRTGIRSLRGVDFDRLTIDDFNLIESWLKRKSARKQLIKPEQYQLDALENIKHHFQVSDRGTIVMACGTGKTLIALWAAEQRQPKTVLVLLPSLTLLQQTLEEWSANNSLGTNFSYLCVCSDPQVGLRDDEMEVDSTDVPFRIDTDPEIVRAYLAQDNEKTKIIFATYQSSHVVSKATQGKIEFDIGIFDEAHKTTGVAAGRFALALNDNNIKINKRLFFTATPRHFDISKRGKDGEFKFVSMDDEGMYGKRVHTLTFGDAASRGIICPYKVVISLIDKAQVDDFALKNGITLLDGDSVKLKWVASQISVASAIKQTGSKKVITFHSRVKAANDFASSEVFGISRFIENFDVFHVNGKQKSNERKETISKFRSANQSLITNARCLTEGIDVPAVDMVAFIDPRHSKIDIAQAVGRAMRKPRGGHKKVGYIVIPIFSENLSEVSVLKALKSEDFEDVALVLNALLDQDEELVEIVKELKENIGSKKPFNPTRLKVKVEVAGPVIGLDELENSIYIEAIDRLGESWDESFGKLKRYLELKGDCLVPHLFTTDDGYSLGKWVGRQRLLRKQNLLSETRRDTLDSLQGWSWGLHDEQWNEGFNYLKQFIEREGHSRVPRNYIENGFNLGKWVGTQRAVKGKFDEIRNQLLNDLGFVWDQFSEQWEDAFTHLKLFRDREGHCLVPLRHVEGSMKLGTWVSHQRKNKDGLSEDRKERLNGLGFVWTPLSQKWEEGFNALQQFILREGHCKVNNPDHVEQFFPLGKWVRQQRKLKATLANDRVKRLNEVGFIWEPADERWDEALLRLKAFFVREGHSQVPHKHKEDGFSLGQWVSVQRRKKNDLSESRINSLNSLNFVWHPKIDQWEKVLHLLMKFKDREGHCRIPSHHIEDGFDLGASAINIRAWRSQLSLFAIKELNDLGFFGGQEEDTLQSDFDWS